MKTKKYSTLTNYKPHLWETTNVTTCAPHRGTLSIGPGGTDSPRFCMGQDCLWDSEEQDTGFAQC